MATFFNQATLSYSGGQTSSNIVSGELVEALSVTKTATLETYRSGERLTYVIGLVNTSASSIGPITLSDDLGAVTTETGVVYPLSYVDASAELFINGVPATAPTAIAGPPLLLSGITVPAGGNAVVVYSVDVTEFASPEEGGSIVNTITASGAGIATPVSASETVTAADGPLLSITKAVDPVQVVGGEPLTYTFVISNSGNTPATATDDVTVTDVFDPILNITSVTLDGTPLAEVTDYSYDEGTGVFTTVPGRITVPAATFTVDPVTGAFVTTPGTTTLTVTGTV